MTADGRKVRPRIVDGEKQCLRCNEMWPLEPEPDGDGNPVRFWFTWSARCYACILEVIRERRHREKAAA